MSRPLAITLDDATFQALETAAARAGQSAATFLVDQLAIAIGSGRVARDQPASSRRQHRSARRRPTAETTKIND